VKSRRFVCNDPRVRHLLEQFIPTADNPQQYRLVKSTRAEQALEYRLLYHALMQTGFRRGLEDSWHVQGMYVITPSGKLLAGGNRPMNVESALADMRKGLEAYAAMPRAERLLARAPHSRTDRMFPDRQPPRPPDGGLVLRSTARGLDVEFVHEQSDLAPDFYHIDRLWYTREEAMQFLPSVLRPGATTQVTGPVLDGLAQLYLMAQGAGSHFEIEHLKERQLGSEVIATNGHAVSLRLTGRVVSEADNDVIRKKYRADLLGYLTYNTAEQRFTRFDLLAYGKHNVPASQTKSGTPASMPLGILFTLNPTNVNDRQPPRKLALYRWVKLKAAQPGAAEQ